MLHILVTRSHTESHGTDQANKKLMGEGKAKETVEESNSKETGAENKALGGCNDFQGEGESVSK